MAEGISSLLQNKLFLQYLSGAGSAISSGQPIGAGIDPITQQNISAQNYAKERQKQMKILQEMLSGKIPTGGKMVISDKGMNLDVPKTAFGAESLNLAQEGAGLPGGSGTDWSKPENYSKLGAVNPFVNSQPSDISGADLAGLTPQDISQALQDVVGVEKIGQQKVSGLVDSIYKDALTQEALTRVKDAEPSVVIPGTDIKLSKDQYLKWYQTASKDERTAAIKNYEYAQTEKGGEFEGSLDEFMRSAKTAHEKDYERAVAEGYKSPGGGKPNFHEWLLEVTKASAMTIGEKADTAGAVARKTAEARRKAEVLDPSYARQIEEDLQSSMGRAAWMNLPKIQEYMDEYGYNRTEAARKAHQVMVLESWDMEIRKYAPGAEFRFDKDPKGWYTGDKLIVESPYNE